MLNLAFAGTVPLQGTDVAARWDNLYSFLVWLSVFFFILVVGAMLYFIKKYPHQPGRKTSYITGNHFLEGIWIAVPTLLLLMIFGWGYSVYQSMTQAPSDAYEIRVLGKQWLWTFQYDNGRTTVGEVYVPMNRPVKLIMTSEDVLHGFFIPNFRIKQDVVPGMYTSLWFSATVPGKHQVFCTDYCGTSHSGMLAKLIVLDDEDWNKWNRGKTLGEIQEAGQPVALNRASDTLQTSSAARVIGTVSLVEQGKALYQNKGCASCHYPDRPGVKVGPSHQGLFGSRVELKNGKTIIANENYIRNHIENPQTNVVKGFDPIMPTFKGLLTETEMNALIAYIKSLK